MNFKEQHLRKELKRRNGSFPLILNQKSSLRNCSDKNTGNKKCHRHVCVGVCVRMCAHARHIRNAMMTKNNRY